MTQEAKHTPGKWEAVYVGVSSAGDDGAEVFEVVADGRVRVAEYLTAGDAYLCAASKDLLGALQEAGDWFALTKRPLDQWEDLAEEFRKETGFLRPGKDMPAAGGWDEEREAERSTAWKQWSEKRRDEMTARVRAAIARTTPAHQ